jgi:hypothetical protein
MYRHKTIVDRLHHAQTVSSPRIETSIGFNTLNRIMGRGMAIIAGIRQAPQVLDGLCCDRTVSYAVSASSVAARSRP